MRDDFKVAVILLFLGLDRGMIYVVNQRVADVVDAFLCPGEKSNITSGNGVRCRSIPIRMDNV